MSRQRTVIVSCIVIVTFLAWAYLIRMDHAMSASPPPGSVIGQMGMAAGTKWSARDFLFTFAMWTVMMVGMMLPSAAPVLLLFARMRSSSGDMQPPMTGAFFAAAHMSVWVGFSLVAALLQWQLHQAMLLSPGMAVTSSRFAGVILIAAGVYQLSPIKAACLTRCQSPLAFLLTNWREGQSGALRLGLRHGTYCLGCCWALMLVLFVVGVMNLAWVAALSVFILFEKLGPGGVRVAQLGGVAMILAGASRI